MTLAKIFKEIQSHPSNVKFRKKGWAPVYSASTFSKIVIVGQAPGRKAQEDGYPVE